MGCLKSSYHDIRCETRFPTDIAGMARSENRYERVRLIDISDHGCMVEGLSIPQCGQHIRLSGRGYDIGGVIRWIDGRNCGVKFDTAIHALAVVRANFRCTAPVPREGQPLPARHAVNEI